MRWSTVLGVLAGILVVAGAIGAFLVSLAPAGEVAAPPPIVVGSSGSPPSGSVATGSPSARPTSRGSPTASGPRSPAEGPTPLPTPGASTEIGLTVGDTAPPLALEGLGGDGAAIDTRLLRGKPVWVNFVATYCPPCRDELPLMQRIQDAQGESITILLVDVAEDEATVQGFVDSLGVTLPVGLDRDGRAVDAWRALALPIHYWLDGEGIIRGVVYGGAGPDVLLDGLRTVLPKATLPP